MWGGIDLFLKICYPYQKKVPLSHHLEKILSPSFTEKSECGLHIVANFGSDLNNKLTFSDEFRAFIDIEINHHKLTKLGEVYHDFSTGGYTAVICLSESHLSVHTWPESNYLTFDIFLSNHLRNNRKTTIALFEKVKIFFNAQILFEKFIDR